MFWFFSMTPHPLYNYNRKNLYLHVGLPLCLHSGFEEAILTVTTHYQSRKCMLSVQVIEMKGEVWKSLWASGRC